MARISGPLAFSGTISNLSAYKMRGVEGYILRSKGGPARKIIKTAPQFEQTRKNNSEFGIRSLAARQIIRILSPLKSMGDYNIAGPLNALLRHAQQIDRESPAGERMVLLSRYPGILQAFSLNKTRHFDSIVRTSIHYEMQTEPASLKIKIPASIPSVNFFPPGNYPLYGFVAVFGVVPDVGAASKHAIAANDFWSCWPVVNSSSWFGCSAGNAAFELNFDMPPVALPKNGCSLLLGIGIRFGQFLHTYEAGQVRYAGAAKVLGCNTI